MTNNTNLLPGQLVDVEFRWREFGWDDVHEVSLLQTRKLLKTDSGELTWTDWADVPVVEEG